MTENEAINELQANIDLPFGFTVSDEASEMAIQALEKQIPKEPKVHDYKDIMYSQCPICGEMLRINQPFCDGCGQKLDWE